MLISCLTGIGCYTIFQNVAIVLHIGSTSYIDNYALDGIQLGLLLERFCDLGT